MATFVVPPHLPKQMAKDFLRKHAGISLTLWRKIKQSDSFQINGIPEKASLATVQANDRITYTLKQSSEIVPTCLPLCVRYEDEYLLIVDKPAGQLVHPTTKERARTLANAILYHYAKNQLSLTYHPVHRLDKNTSGLVLIAKQPHIQHLLSSGNHKDLQRTYLALVKGKPQPDAGTIDLPIARRPDSIIERTVADNGQRAITHYHTRETFADCSLLQLELETGRTHQIRVHLAALGHPIIGDGLYGGPLSADIQRQALHASHLQFTHPVTRQIIHASSPLPPDIKNYIVNHL